MFDYVWLIPFLPFVGVLVNGLFGRRIENINKSLVHWIACGSVGLAFFRDMHHLCSDAWA
jgi:NADH:ubiquinone oxidoreductase subunit 5 (subunit L)/multisubunit Na+/H+ antiporter MnhA subunit